jgi:hypothetical protein
MDDKAQTIEEQSIVHDLDEGKKPMLTKQVIFVLFIAVLLGVGTGYLFSKKGTGGDSTITKGGKSAESTGVVVGSDDTKTFNDTAEGVLEEGGIEGEGQFHLVRPGGPSQYVYLTSSLIDLSLYKKKKVKVWGQTNAAQKAGWLMDVGRLEVLK